MGDGTPLDDSSEQYNIQGLFILQDIKFRLGNSGAGKAAEKIGELGGEDTRTTIGGGFRYLIARRLGLRAGIDVARGPEEWAIYLPFGNAWLM